MALCGPSLPRCVMRWLSEWLPRKACSISIMLRIGTQVISAPCAASEVGLQRPGIVPLLASLLSHSARARSSFLQASLKSLSLLGN